MPLTRLLGAARRRLLARGTQPIPEATGRRQFLQRASALGAAAVGAGLMLPDEAWAGIEARAARFGIVPGTFVDANGRPAVPEPGISPFLGEVMLVGFTFATRDWALCDGQLLPINSYQSLYSLLGTTYGGDGRTTFALPDLRGRHATHFGQGPGLSSYDIGERVGTESVVLTADTAPSHTHAQPVAGTLGTTRDPSGNVPAVDSGADQIYGPTATTGQGLQPTAPPAVGGQAHDNMAPYLVLNYQIALQGLFPSRN